MRKLLIFLLCSTWMIGQSKISDNQIRTPPPLQCSDTTTSGTTQTCTTAPSFTPAAKDCVTYNTTTTNTGALTLNVNSQGAKPVQKWLGTALVAGDVVANKPQLACYDGTNWQLSTIGNAPGAGTGTVTSVTCNAGLTGGAITTSGTCALATSATGAAGLILLETHTASSSATLDFTTCISSTYDEYLFTITSLVNATNTQDLQMLVGTGGTPTYQTSSYEYVTWNNNTANSGFSGNASTSAAAIILFPTQNNASTYGANARIFLHDPQNATLFKALDFTIDDQYQPSARQYRQDGSAWWDGATALTAIRFKFASGNITSGTIRCYGQTK